MKQQPILSVQDLKKHFGTFRAVDGISFDVKKGEIVGLLGPNGAGKTTTIQMLLGLMSQTSGTISYFGLPFHSHRVQILKRINAMSGYGKMPWRLTVWENLVVFAHLYEVNSYKQKIQELAKRFEVTDLFKKSFQDLSAGQATRVNLVKAFLNDPELVLLDEPTASLDPDISVKIRQFILAEQKRKNLSILITSHNMAEVEEVCDRVIFLHHGKIVAIDSPENLARKNSSVEVNLMITDGLKRTSVYLRKKKFTFTESNRFVTVKLPEKEIVPFLHSLSENNIEYKDIEINRPSLEDFFLKMAFEKGNK